MLYCMALTTSEIIKLNKEVHRILKPGAINIFTVRHTGDGDYKKGKHIGEDLYENDGFIVHFFDKEKINQISKEFKIEDIFELHEGSFPRKLFVVTQRKNDHGIFNPGLLYWIKFDSRYRSTKYFCY